MKKILAITSTVAFLCLFAVLASAQRTPGYFNAQSSKRSDDVSMNNSRPRYDAPRGDYRYPDRDRYDDRRRDNDRDRRYDDRNDRGRHDQYGRGHDKHHHHDHDRYSDRRRYDERRNGGYVDYRNRDRYDSRSKGKCAPRDRDRRGRW